MITTSRHHYAITESRFPFRIPSLAEYLSEIAETETSAFTSIFRLGIRSHCVPKSLVGLCVDTVDIGNFKILDKGINPEIGYDSRGTGGDEMAKTQSSPRA